MKTKMALLALALILTFGITANVSAAVMIATTGIRIGSNISLTEAYNNTAPDHLNISTTNPGPIFLSFRIDNGGQPFTLNSVSIDISLNGIPVSSESYSTYSLGGTWSRMGVYATNSYGFGLMNQGEILVGCGSRDSSIPYTTSNNPGDIWRALVTYDVQGQGSITSLATLTNIPETSTTILIAISTLVFLRRKRK